MRSDERPVAALLATFAVAVDVFLVWFALRTDTVRGLPFAGVVMPLAAVAGAIAPIGTVWMWYQSIRYESRAWPYVLLAFFVPYAFVWYYFSRVRGQCQPARRGAPLR